MSEASRGKGLGIVQRALALTAGVALLVAQGAYTYSEGFSAPGWLFAAVVSGLLLTVAFWGAKFKPAPRKTADAPAPPPRQVSQVEEEGDELDLDPEYEIEQRAGALVADLINRNSEAATSTTATDQEASEPLPDRKPTELVIREHSLWLMLGLVSLRRARGDEDHVKRPAYLKLQHSVLQTIFSLRRAASQDRQGLTPEEANGVKAAMRQVQTAIIKGCSARKEGVAHPEQDLVAWFNDCTGIDLLHSPHVNRALKGKAWPAAGGEG